MLPHALAHAPAERSLNWNTDPLTWPVLLGLALAYHLGHRRAGKVVGAKEYYLFMGSITVLLVALISPLAAMSEDLQAWHMIQHMLIMMVAAPLFVMGAPLHILLWSLPAPFRKHFAPLLGWLNGQKSGWYFLWQPIILWAVFALTLWVWHLPNLYQAALAHQRLHDLQHISFFASACLFWRILLDPFHRLKLGRGLGIMYLFATSLHATLLGVYMTLSPKLWYPFYQGRTRGWSISEMEDQQLAGLIMWMPACSIYVLIGALLFYRWLQENSNIAQFPIDPETGNEKGARST
jgi:putative membrane protein